MKRILPLLLIVAILAGGAYLVSNYQFVTARLNLDMTPQSDSTVWASGMIEADDTEIVAEINGRVMDILADEGDEVETGSVLIRLDTAVIDDQINGARAAVHTTQANLDAALKPVRDEEIAIARARLAKADAERGGSARTLQNAIEMRDNPLELNAQVNEARSQVEISAEQVEAAQAQLAQAEAGRDHYQFAASDQDKAQYQMYLKQVDAARSAIAGAAAAHEGMKQRLANLLEIRDNPIHLNVSVNTARSQLNLTEHAMTVAEAELSLLGAGPRTEDVAIAQAQVDLAQAVLEELEVQRGKMTLRSPASGSVSTRAVEQGEVATAGRTLLTISNLDKVTLMVYIPEDEIGKIEPGQGVDIYVDTFPDQPFPGVVSFIASEAEFTPKSVQTQKERVNMVFAVKVDLPNAGHSLKPGMTADASIHLNETAAPEVVAALKSGQPEAPPVSPAPSPVPTATPTPLRPDDRHRKEVPTHIAVTRTPDPTPTPSPVEVVSPIPSPEPGPVSHPSGKVIFVTQDDTGVYNLWEIGTDGADRRLIGRDMHQPDVRGDGMLLVNGAGAGRQESLLTLRLDGSDLQEVSMYSNDVNPQWAPDGARLVYVNEQVGELVLQESLQKDARRLPLYFDITPLLGRHPAWIDDEHVVYQGCDVWRGGSLCGLYVARVTGGVPPWRVVDDTQATAPAVSKGRIAYMSNAHGNWDIFLLDPERSGPRQLTDELAEDGLPTWSPDGEWLAFLSNRGGEWAGWAVRPEEGRDPVKLFDMGGSPGQDWAGERMVWVTHSE